jgi:hypothetical protein
VADVNMGFSGMRMLKNTGGQVDNKLEGFRTTLLGFRRALLDEATITTEITALQILDEAGVISATVGIISTNVGIISANIGRVSSQLDGMATQLKWVSSEVSDVGT